VVCRRAVFPLWSRKTIRQFVYGRIYSQEYDAWCLLPIPVAAYPKTTVLPPPMKTAATNLRLTPRERDGIRSAVQKACGETGAVWRRVVVFGSRTDPNRRGGDIDLLVELEPARLADTFRLNQRLRLALEDELGEQRIDLVLDDGNVDSAFPTLARETGVELWSNT